MLKSTATDFNKGERDFESMNLSDENVVRNLILYRSKVDLSEIAVTNVDMRDNIQSFNINEELICLYIALDNIVKNIDISDRDRSMIELLFVGYTIEDMVELHGYSERTAYRILSRTVKKITVKNYDMWRKSKGFRLEV